MLKIAIPPAIVAALALLSLLAWASYDVTGSSPPSPFETGLQDPGKCDDVHEDEGGEECDDDEEEDDKNENDSIGGADDCEDDGSSSTITNCEPPSTGPVEGPEVAATDPVETVRAFYLRLTEKRFADAYALFTPALQSSEDFAPFDVWVRGYDTTASITPLAATIQEQDEHRALVAVELESVDQDPSGSVTTSWFAGTWRLMRSNGRWLLADTHIVRLDSVAGIDDCQDDGSSSTITNCEPPSTGPLEGPEESGTDPVETVRAFYLRLTERRFADAYALLTPALQSSEDFAPFDVWVRGYDTTASITPLAATIQEQDEHRALVVVELESVDRDSSGSVTTNRFVGTWSLLRSNGQWLLAGTQMILLESAPD